MINVVAFKIHYKKIDYLINVTGSSASLGIIKLNSYLIQYNTPSTSTKIGQRMQIDNSQKSIDSLKLHHDSLLNKCKFNNNKRFLASQIGNFYKIDNSLYWQECEESISCTVGEHICKLVQHFY